MFDALFKFNRTNFSEGSLGLLSENSVVLVVLILLVFLAGMILLYRRSDRFSTRKQAAVSFGLRTAVLLLLCVPLLEPTLAMPDVVPDENFVAVVVDASESMNVPDATDGTTRRDEVRRLLLGDARAVAPALEEYFKVRCYSFGSSARRLDSVDAPAATEHQTNISAALDRVLSDFRGLPLAGVVLMTDGGDNSDAVPLNSAEELHARNIPLHIVGIGREEGTAEREVIDAVVSRGVEQSTSADVDVKVRSWRAEAEPVVLSLSRNGEVVHEERVTLKGEGKIDQITFSYEPSGTEASEYSLQVAAANDELNVENNKANLLIDPRQDTLRVLFIEGHPRREFKFVKRALEDDAVVQFASILRTGTGKFYRQGIRHPDELAGGFPATEEELFGYDAVLFGDVEASHFSLDQLRMIERFVRLRGGGFAMLGGRLSFAEGGYWDNPIADLLPVQLDPDRRSVVPPSFTHVDEEDGTAGYEFLPTSIGLENPILRLAATPTVNQTQWRGMPTLTSINYLGAAKPGAVVLAEKPEDEFGGREPLLVIQRYGKGRSAALATASTWRWQMQLEADDQRHERFWRQFVRWLAASAPGRVDVDLDGDRFAPGEEIGVRMDVYDERYRPIADAFVIGRLTDPAGEVRDVEVRPDLGQAGSYTAILSPAMEGVHTLTVEATAEGQHVGRGSRSFLIRPTKQEYSDAVLKREFLQHLAENADGIYYTPDQAYLVAENVRSRRTNTSIYRVDYLWDMPFIFGLALLLWSTEWIWRRRKGLP